MSISSTTRKAGPFAGDGSTTVFPFTFKVFATSDLVVTEADEDGVETVLDLGVDYGVTINGDQDSAPGGSVTLTGALATDHALVLTSAVPLLQQVVITNGGSFMPSVLNNALDRLTIFSQQLDERIGRQLAVPVTNDTVTNFSVPVLAGAVLQWNADGTALVAQTLPDLALSLALPSMTGQSGKFLTNNGVSAQWATADFSSYALKTRTVIGAGMAWGGGALTGDLTITVTAADQTIIRAGSNTDKPLSVGHTYSALEEVALTYSGSTIVTSGSTLDNTLFIDASITLNQNSTIPNLTSPVNRRSGQIKITQDGTTARTLSFGSNWKFPNNVTPSLTTTLGGVAFLDYKVISSTYIRAALTNMG